MVKRTLARLALAAAALASPGLATAQQAAEPPTIYTFVAEWQIARAQWGAFATDFDKNTRPILEKLAANGTLVGWGVYETVVHTADGYTHGSWWQATSYAGLEKARLELIAASAASGSLASATGHRDLFLRSLGGGSKSGSGSGYLSVSQYMVKPGQGTQWKQLWDKNTKPLMDDLVAKGTLVGYAVHTQDVHTDAPGLRYVVTVTPSIEAEDQVGAAWDAADAKLTPEERRTRQLQADNLVEPAAHRDIIARVIRYWSK